MRLGRRVRRVRRERRALLVELHPEAELALLDSPERRVRQQARPVQVHLVRRLGRRVRPPEELVEAAAFGQRR